MGRNARRKKGGKKRAPLGSAGVIAAAKQGAQPGTREWESAAWEMDRRRRALEAVEPLVTFVVPTLGRDSLNAALASLVVQTNGRWSAIVVGDGIQPAIKADRFESVRAQKCGSAGLLRNVGMRSTQSKAPWFAFLDDDDVLKPDYVERLDEETRNPPGAGAALVLFRMVDKDGLIKPQPVNPTLVKGWVGISFAVRREWPLEHGVEFIREEVSAFHHEDIAYVEAIQASGGVVHISDHVTYQVRGEQIARAI